ncbi:hypothetical protein JCM33374_g4685 [Metschnikowia sp. JCM 33374]|nr:hypothetical protein JCM33374_g4685 [Metschnikowia sp. JCM 33374]
MSELLVSRQGPLAHVWLASNYDKKLSKQQFLNTNIVTSSNLISNRQVQPSSGNSTHETITLRLSGQLLLGIVRIYSRKTKYLLDDIHETLHKLKTSFKYASGASLGSSSAGSGAAGGGATVNLPPQKTTISNLSRITLQDQISGHDLFYQDDLVLDEASDRIANAVAQFPQETIHSQQDPAQDPDRSIEVARRSGDHDMDADMDADIDANADVDLDLDLDFDLDMDNSIEVGRDAQTALSDADQSLLDINPKAPDTARLPEVNFDLDVPLGAPVDHTTEDSDGPHEAQTPPQNNATPNHAPRRLVGISESGVIRTNKRRLVVDEPEDLERGVPTEVLRNIQNLQTQGRLAEGCLTLRLSTQEKLDLINELAAPIQAKKRKIWNLDEQLRQRCLELSNAEEEDDFQNTSAEHSADLDFDMDTNLDFDLSLPGLDSDDVLDPLQMQVEQNDDEHIDGAGPENLRSTSQVAEHLRHFFFDKPAVTLDELMEKDTAPGMTTPLGLTHKSDSTMKVSNRREATKCFFELLVLATHDCVSLEQESSNVVH